MHCLLSPKEYEPAIKELRAKNKYACNWTMRIERKTNRHPETNGHPWGWYEVFPLGITVGYWGSSKDDLNADYIKAWNEEANNLTVK